ncbi:MAG: hypothetical protein Q4G10_05250 [Bacteroidia bacterium]|nr:hypothetical protein [Bacteroidia bacterium]
MKKSLMMIGLAMMMCGTSGCFTMLNNAYSGWGDGGASCSRGSSVMEGLAVVGLDVVTLPLQAAAVVLVGGGWLIWTGGEWVVEGTEKLFD